MTTRAPSPTDDATLTEAEMLAMERRARYGVISWRDNLRLLAALRAARAAGKCFECGTDAPIGRPCDTCGSVDVIAPRDVAERIGGYLDDERKRAEAAEAREQALREALATIAEEHDAGRHDGQPEPCPAHDADVMWAIARAALASPPSPTQDEPT